MDPQESPFFIPVLTRIDILFSFLFLFIGAAGTCFSAMDTVEVKGVGSVSMDRLRIGDWVRTSVADKDAAYSRVYSFHHIDPDVEVEFLQLYTDQMQLPIEITADHMIFTATGKAVRASQVQVGDVLTDQHPVTKIESVKRRGLYAPVTESGDIVVNGVVASCYVALLDTTLINQHALAHATCAIKRLACGMMPSLCNEETYDEDGFPMFVAPLFHTVRMINRQNGVVKAGAVLAAIPGIYAVYGIEQMLSNPGLVILALLSLGYKFWMNKKQNHNKNHAMKIKSA
jgi:hypothetical protein